MKLNFVIATCFLMSGFAFGENDNDANAQNYDLIEEYFDSALENNREDVNNPEMDDNRFNRVAQSTDGTTASDASGSPAPTTESAPADDATKSKKTVKKKKKKKGSGEAEVATASGHGTQESGAPYSANVDLGLTYSSTSKTRKYSDTPLKDTSTELELTLMYLFVFGKIEIGPMIAYTSQNEKTQNSSTSTTTTTITGMGLGGAFYFNIGNIHQDKFVPYAGLTFLRFSAASTSKSEGSSEIKSSSSSMDAGVELGGKYFMGGHVALKPFLNFDMTLSGDNKDDSSGTELVASVTGSKLSLGLGMATYF